MDSSHHGVGKNESQDSCNEDNDSGRGWYFSRSEIEEKSPSRRDGIDLKKEAYFRKSYCAFLQDLGMRLKVPQVTIATAIVLCHRFFLRQSHAKNDRRAIATVCMFLAGKSEETPRPLKDVILVSYEIIHKKDPSAIQRIKQKEVYEQQKELILFGERLVLATLGFDLNVLHPYKPLVEAIKKFKVAQNALAQVAWNFVNDGLRTSLCLQFKPQYIAAGALFLAAKFIKVKLPSDGEKVWWQEFDVTPRQLEEVSNQMLELYEQNRPAQPSHGIEANGSSSCTETYHPKTYHPTATTSAECSVSVDARQAARVIPPSGPLGTQLSNDWNYSNNHGTADSKSGACTGTDHPTASMSAVNECLSSVNVRQASQVPPPYRPIETQLNARNHGNNKGSSDSKSDVCNYDLKDNSYHQSGLVSRYRESTSDFLDKDNVKAALERARKFRNDAAKKKEHDPTEWELRDRHERAMEDDGKMRGWPKPSHTQLQHPLQASMRRKPLEFVNGNVSTQRWEECSEDGEISSLEDHGHTFRKAQSNCGKRKLDEKGWLSHSDRDCKRFRCEK